MISLITQPTDITLAKNPMWFEFEVVHALLPANHRVKLRIQIERTYQSDEYDFLDIELEEIVNSANRAVFDISAIIEAEYQRTETIPSYNQTTSYIADNVRRYKILYTESYGDPQVDQPWLEIDPLTAFWGGVDQANFGDYDFFDSLGVDNSLLSYYPSGKRIGLQQPEFLSWYNHTDSEQEILVEFERWTEAEQLLPIYPSPQKIIVNPKQVAVLPIGIAQIGSYIEYPVLMFRCRITDARSDWESGNPTYLSQSKTYYIDHKGYDDVYHLLYFNSFGLPESFRCTGALKKDLDVRRGVSSVVLRKGYKSTAKSLTQHSVDWSCLYTFRSGYISQKEVSALQELLILNDFYLLTSRGYYPMLTETKKFRIEDSFEFLHSLEFVAVRSLRAIHYSNAEISFSTPASILPTPDQGVEFTLPPADELVPVESLLATDDLLILRDGTLELVTPDMVVEYLIDKVSCIKAYKTIEGAKADNLTEGQAFLAADPNLMAVPPGTLIFIPKEEV